MTERRWTTGRAALLLAMVGVGGLAWRMSEADAGQPPSFDKLPASEKPAIQQRFEKEIWPLLSRGGKKGCVGCHSGRTGNSVLKFTGTPATDFAMLLHDGFLLPDDAGSLLSRITDRDPERRMPPEKASTWSDADAKVLLDFVRDLDRKQARP